MSNRHPCGGLGRRQFLAAAAAASRPGRPDTSRPRSRRRPRTADADRPASSGIPGPYPGRVIEARNPAMIQDGVKNREAIKATVGRGMKELTGADDAVEAWRTLLRAGRRRRDQDEPRRQPAGQLLAAS